MEAKQMIMKKFILLLMAVTVSVITYAQTSNTEKVKWGVFVSATCNRDDISVENMKQVFIDITQNANRYYWGKDNYTKHFDYVVDYHCNNCFYCI